MKKISFIFISLLFITPILSFADSYDGPYCFEGVEMNSNVEGSYGNSEIRGTCKEIKIFYSVSVDTNLKRDYLLGEHYPIGYDCYRGFCGTYTKYSETIMVTSTSTLSGSTLETGSEPTSVALFDKTFFIPTFTKLFKNKRLPFPENSFSDVSIHILKKDEIDTIEKEMRYSLFDKYKKDDLIQIENHDLRSTSENNMITFLYQEYGKYIHAPKGDIYESSYTDVEKSTGLLTNKDLGITVTQARYALPTVSPMSPLDTVTNYWLYTKKNDKLVLAWQKTEYTLDDGSVKTVTKDDKNITATMLFRGSKSIPTSSSSATIAGASSSISNTMLVPTPTLIKKHFAPSLMPAETPQNFFQTIINFLASLFN